jgi:hypothetical protein
MFRLLITYLTIAALLACPLICSGRAAMAGETDAGSGCCSHCRKAPDPGSQDRPESETDGCQCLCKGAICSRPVDDLARDEAAAVPAMTMYEAAPTLWLATRARAVEGRSPLLTTGRMLRLMHCSLRC